MRSNILNNVVNTPIRSITDHREFGPFYNEENYFQTLKQSALKIFASLCTEKQQFELMFRSKQLNYNERLQEKQRVIQELLTRNSQLQSQVNQFKLNLDQTMRFMKRYEMKIQLLGNKISHLSKEISEKEAIIKYLEGKNQKMTRYNSNTSFEQMIPNETMGRIEDLSVYNKNQLSFARLKDNKLKFQNYSNATIKNNVRDMQQQQSNLKIRSKRIRTQSANDVKQNSSTENSKISSQSKLQELLGRGQWGNNNQKTLSKKGHNTSFCWGVDKRQNGRKSVNANNSFYFNDYRQAESYRGNQAADRR